MATSRVLLIAVCFLFTLYSCNSQTTSIYPELCGLAGYDTLNLTKASYWYFHKDDKCFPKDNETTSCDFYVTFCQGLTSVDTPFDETCKGAGACLLATTGENKTSYDIGNYGGHDNQFIARTDGSGFFYSYPGGGELDCGTVHTLMNFKCDSNTPWEATDGEPTQIPGVPLVDFINFENRTCVYNITVNYAGACPIPMPFPTAAPGSGLSVGSILLIIFIPTIALYFIIGIAINKIQGIEQLLPHQEFWSNLPGYVSDGMKYAWAVVTCRNTGSSDAGYESI